MFHIDNMTSVFCGAVADADMSSVIQQEINAEIDILFVPIAGEQMDAAGAAKIVKFFSPKLIIPMDYKKSDDLKIFLEEMGSKECESVEKLTTKSKDLPSEGHRIVEIKNT